MGKYFPPESAEVHSFGIGMMNGIAHNGINFNRSLDIAEDNFDDVRREKHYYRTGYFITNRGKWIISTALALKTVLPGVIA